MNIAERKSVFAIANNKSIDLLNVDDSILYGCGLPEFRPVHTTKEVCAKMVRHIGMQLNGKWDMEEVNQFFILLKRKVTLIN